MKDFVANLNSRFQEKLPGPEAQYLMAPSLRKRYASAPDTARIACVLALFYPKNNQPHLVLIERQSKNPNDRHGGQISFPGGKQDPDDSSLENVALREAEEEVGVVSSDITITGRLTDLYIPVSNFLVHPFVGVMSYAPTFNPQLSEVAAIIETPFSNFHRPEIRREKDLKVSKYLTMRSVPYFDVENKVIWGATAMILNELIELTN